MKPRQESDTRQRYNALVTELTARFPRGAIVPRAAIISLMEELDMRMSHPTTQCKFIRYLESDYIYGRAVVLLSERNEYEIMIGVEQEKLFCDAELELVING